MDINFNETHVFSYSSEKPSIGIWKNDKYIIGWINFYDWEQLNHFKEMLEFAIEKQSKYKIKGE